MTSITDLRYRTLDSISEWQQARSTLEGMEVCGEAIDWFFEIIRQKDRAYAALQARLAEVESQLPEEA